MTDQFIQDYNRAEDNAAPKRAVTVCVGDVQPEPINWLWTGRIARGKVSMIAGDPGLGKSLVSLDMAARVTTGKPWPVDNSRCPLGSVVLLSAEDDIADTIRPRLDAAGADVRRVHVVQSVRERDKDGRESTRSVSLKKDLDEVELVLSRLSDCALVIIDPISAYMEGIDSHVNTEVRSLFTPLGLLASRSRVAIVVVSHLNKGSGQNAIYRITGSLGFTAAARAVYGVTKDQDDPRRRLFVVVKNNLGNDETGLAYRVETGTNSAPLVIWESEPVTLSAEEAFAPAQTDDARTELDAAMDWLETLLKDGPVFSKDVQTQAKAAGIAWATVRRAKSGLKIKPTKDSDGAWSWSLPKMLNPAPPVEHEHLEHLEHLPFSPEEKGMVQGAENQDAQVPSVSTLPRLWRPAGNGKERAGWRTTDLPGSLEEVRETLTRELGYSVEVRE